MFIFNVAGGTPWAPLLHYHGHSPEGQGSSQLAAPIMDLSGKTSEAPRGQPPLPGLDKLGTGMGNSRFLERSSNAGKSSSTGSTSPSGYKEPELDSGPLD